jgi:hypothetical protein
MEINVLWNRFSYITPFRLLVAEAGEFGFQQSLLVVIKRVLTAATTLNLPLQFRDASRLSPF